MTKWLTAKVGICNRQYWVGDSQSIFFNFKQENFQPDPVRDDPVPNSNSKIPALNFNQINIINYY